MNNILKVSKYQLIDIKKAIIIFYSVIFSVGLFMIYITKLYESNGTVNFGGFGMSSVIFLFVTGLNCFKNNFMFMQANNVSRKRFYFANIIALLSVSALMAVIDVLINNIFNMIVPYEGLFQQLYRNDFIFADFLWSFAFFGFASNLGWFINMMYYRSNKIMKWVISLIPVVVIILIPIFNDLTDGAFGKALIDFFGTAFGFYHNFNSYIAVLSFFIATAGLLFFNFMLIRNATIKE